MFKLHNLVGVLVAVALLTFFTALSAREYRYERLDSLIEEAIKSNPEIQRAYNDWKASEYKITQVRSLPDPMARYGFFGESIETRVGPQEHKFGLSQKIPFPSKLITKGKSQIKTAEILKEEYEAVKREIIKAVKFTYYDIFWVDTAIRVTRGEKAILENLERVAKRKYESKLAPQQDVVKAQVEISKLIDKLFVLKENRSSLVAQMNTILNRTRKTPFAGVANIKVGHFPYDLDLLREMADDSRQDLQKARLSIEKAEHEKYLAKLDYVPDFTFGFDYNWVGGGRTTRPNDGDNAWLGTISINIPLWFHKLGAKVKEKRATLKARKKNYENVRNIVDYEVENLYYKIASYRNIAELYRTALIPQTEQSFDAAKLGYESGEVDFLNWLDAERTLLQTRLSYYKSIVDYRKAVAHLEQVVGEDL